MAYRKRHRGTTTERDYGARHVRFLKAYRSAWHPGQPCAECAQPMWQLWHEYVDGRGRKRRMCLLDLGHTPDRTGYIGLCHRYCNRSEGASRGNRMRGQGNGWAQARAW